MTTGYSVTTPVDGEILPMLFPEPPDSTEIVNHRLPSEPAIIPLRLASEPGTEYSVTSPFIGEILPISFPLAAE